MRGSLPKGLQGVAITGKGGVPEAIPAYVALHRL